MSVSSVVSGRARGRSGRAGPGRQRLTRLSAFAVVYLVWGSTYLAIRVMVDTVPPLLGAGVRFLAAGLMLATWVLVSRRGRAPFAWRRRQWRAVVVTALLLVVGGPGLTTVAEKGVPSSLAALLVASVPLWVVLWRVAVREPVGRWPISGTVLGLVGVAVLVWPTSGGAIAGASGVGVVLLMVVALSYATGSFLSPRLAMPTDAFAVSAAQMLLAGMVLAAAGLCAGEAAHVDPAQISSASVWALAYLIGPGSLLAYTAYVWLLAHAPVDKVATYAYVNPVVAVILGSLVLAEPITTRMAIGAALTVAAVAAVVSTTKQEH